MPDSGVAYSIFVQNTHAYLTGHSHSSILRLLMGPHCQEQWDEPIFTDHKIHCFCGHPFFAKMSHFLYMLIRYGQPGIYNRCVCVFSKHFLYFFCFYETLV
jgi:hypothetical protein